MDWNTGPILNRHLFPLTSYLLTCYISKLASPLHTYPVVLRPFNYAVFLLYLGRFTHIIQGFLTLTINMLPNQGLTNNFIHLLDLAKDCGVPFKKICTPHLKSLLTKMLIHFYSNYVRVNMIIPPLPPQKNVPTTTSG